MARLNQRDSTESFTAAKRLGHRIRRWRHNQGLAQSEVARLLGGYKKTVSQWELGRSLPHPIYLRRLAAMMDTTVDGLLDQAFRHRR